MHVKNDIHFYFTAPTTFGKPSKNCRSGFVNPEGCQKVAGG